MVNAIARTIPTGFGRCDGHHEMVDFRLEKKQRNGRVVDFRRR
jgi:hypothetical protein